MLLLQKQYKRDVPSHLLHLPGRSQQVWLYTNYTCVRSKVKYDVWGQGRKRQDDGRATKRSRWHDAHIWFTCFGRIICFYVFIFIFIEWYSLSYISMENWKILSIYVITRDRLLLGIGTRTRYDTKWQISISKGKMCCIEKDEYCIVPLRVEILIK